jgi:hypothetical protein
MIAVDVSAVPVDARSVEALARLQLLALRRGRRLRLRNASPQLLDLVSFMGLRDVLPVEDRRPERALALEAQGQPEEREDPLGV